MVTITMPAVNTSASSQKKLSLQDLYPRARRARNGTPTEDDGGGSMVMITWPAMSAPENIAEGPIPPTAGEET
jgi:hypothetical protein